MKEMGKGTRTKKKIGSLLRCVEKSQDRAKGDKKHMGDKSGTGSKEETEQREEEGGEQNNSNNNTHWRMKLPNITQKQK